MIKVNIYTRLVLWIVIVCFSVNTIIAEPVSANTVSLPAPAQLVNLSAAYAPALIRGLKVFKDNPFKFEFVMSKADGMPQQKVKEEADRLIRYFLASLTMPEKDMWVNLSPYEKDRIVPKEFGATEMGKEMLVQDYLLKQVTASVMYPEGEVGKKFWKEIYRTIAAQQPPQGANNSRLDLRVNLSTFNKVWIVPDKAVVYENAGTNTAVIVESKLKVMLEQDYVALNKFNKSATLPKTSTENQQNLHSEKLTEVPQEKKVMLSEVTRQIILPVLEREVNEGKHFASLRQVYHSLILANWYKNKLKQSLISKGYVDKKKTAGLTVDDENINQEVYQQYLTSFKKGVYNYIKEDLGPDNQMVPRKYFSGGVTYTNLAMISRSVTGTDEAMRAASVLKQGTKALIVAVSLAASLNVMSGTAQAANPVGMDYLQQFANSRTGAAVNVIKGDANDISNEIFQKTGKWAKPGQASIDELKRQGLLTIQGDQFTLDLAKLRAGGTVAAQRPAAAALVSPSLNPTDLKFSKTFQLNDNPSTMMNQSAEIQKLKQILGANLKLDFDDLVKNGVISIQDRQGNPVVNPDPRRIQVGWTIAFDFTKLQTVAANPPPAREAAPVPLVRPDIERGTVRAVSTQTTLPAVVTPPPEQGSNVDLDKLNEALREVEKKMADGRVSIEQYRKEKNEITGQINDAKQRASQEPTAQEIAEREQSLVEDFKLTVAPVGSVSLVSPAGTPLIIDYKPSATGIAYLDYQVKQKQLRANTPLRSKLPVDGSILINYDRMDVALQIGGGETTFAVMPDLPGRNLLNLFRIGQGFAQFSTQAIGSKIAGPLVATQTLLDLVNYIKTHPTRGQDMRYDARVSTLGGVIQTVTIHVTPILSFDQDGNKVEENLYSVGLIDTVQAVAGSIDKFLGDTGFFGDSSKKFVGWDGGFQLKVNDYHQAFAHAAAFRKDDNLVFIKVYQVNDPNTRYRKNDRNGWHDIEPQTSPDLKQDYYAATVNGFMLRYDPKSNQITGQRVFTAPTFVTGKFAQMLTEAQLHRKVSGNEHLTTPFMEIERSIADLESEKVLLRGVNAEGQRIWGVLRNPVSGRIEKFIMDPREINAMSRLVDERGNAIAFVPGKIGSRPTLVENAGLVFKDYWKDEFERVMGKWGSLFERKTVGGKYEGYDFSKRPELAELPRELAALITSNNLIFESSGLLKAINEAAKEQYGVIYFTDGRMPAVLTSTRNVRTIASISAREVKKIAENQYQLEGFARRLTGNTLVLVESGKAVGVIDPSERLKLERLAQLERSIGVANVYVDGLANFGVAINANGGIRAVRTMSREFVPAKYAGEGVVGQRFGSRNVVVNEDMLVRVERIDGRLVVKEILEPGKKRMEWRRVELDAIRYGAFEVEDQRTETVVLYANGNDLTPQQIAAGIRPERELAAFVLSGQAVSEPTGDGKMRWIILKEAPPSRLEQLQRQRQQQQRQGSINDKPNNRFAFLKKVVLGAVLGAAFLSADIGNAVAQAPAPIVQQQTVGQQEGAIKTILGPDQKEFYGVSIDAQMFSLRDVAKLNLLGATGVRTYYPVPIDIAQRLVTNTKVKTIIVGIPFDANAYGPQELTNYWGGPVPSEANRISLMANNYLPYIQQLVTAVNGRAKIIIDLGNEPNMSFNYPVWSGKPDTEQTHLELFTMLNRFAGDVKNAFGDRVAVSFTLGDRPEHFALALKAASSVDVFGINYYRHNTSVRNDLLKVFQETGVTKPFYIAEMGTHSNIGEIAQASVVRNDWEIARQLGQSVIFMSLTDNSKKQGANETAYGWEQSNGSPKPVFMQMSRLWSGMAAGPSVSSNDTLAGINSNFALIRWKSDNPARTLAEEARKQLRTDRIPFEKLDENADIIMQEAVEILQVDGVGNIKGRYVKIFGGGFKLWEIVDMDHYLSNYFMIVRKDGKGAEFVSLQDLKDPRIHESVRQIADELVMMDKQQNIVARANLNRNIAGSRIEVMTGDNSKVYPLQWFFLNNLPVPEAETSSWIDSNGLKHVRITDLRPVNKGLVVEDVYRVDPDKKPVKVYSIRSLQKEIIYFKDGNEHYSVSMDLTLDPGVDVVIDGILIKNVTGLYQFNKEAQAGYHISLRDIRASDWYAPLRYSTFEDGQFKVDQKGFVRLNRSNLNFDQIMAKATAEGVFNSQDVYFYHDNGEFERREVSIKRNGAWKQAWILQGGHLGPQKELISNILNARIPVGAWALGDLGVGTDTILTETIKKMPDGVTIIDYRIAGDVLEKKIISVIKQGEAVINIIVGNAFDPRTGEQSSSHEFTPDFQIKSSSSTVQNERTLREIIPVAGMAESYARYMKQHFGVSGANLEEALVQAGISLDMIPKIVRYTPSLLVSDNPDAGSYKDIEPQVRELEAQYIAADDIARPAILQKIKDIVSQYHRTVNKASFSGRGESTDRLLFPNDSQGRNIGSVYGQDDAFGLDLWMLEQMNQFPINVLPGSITVDKTGKMVGSTLYAGQDNITAIDAQNVQYQVAVNRYKIFGDAVKVGAGYTNTNQLVFEDIRNEQTRVANGILGSQYGGVKRVSYDLSVPYAFPLLATLDRDGRITEVTLHTVYSIAHPTGQLTKVSFIEKVPTGGANLSPKIKTRSDVNGREIEGSKYEEDVAHYFKDVLKNWQLYLAYPAMLFGLFTSGSIIRNRRLSKVKKAVAENAVRLNQMEGKDVEVAEPVEINFNQPSWQSYGYSDHIVGVAKERFQGQVVDALNNGETEDDLLKRWFGGYQRWRKEVMKIDAEFMPTMEDLWILFLNDVGSGILRSNLPSVLHYLFHKSIEARQQNKADTFALFVRKEHQRWHTIVEWQGTTFQGLAGGNMKHVVPYDYYFSIKDLKDMFNTRENIIWYDSLGYSLDGNVDLRGAIYADFIDTLKVKVGEVKASLLKLAARVDNNVHHMKRQAPQEVAYKQYIDFFNRIQDGKYQLSDSFSFSGITRQQAMERINNKPLMRKTFSESGAWLGRLPMAIRMIKPISQLIRNNYNPLLNGVALTAATGLAVAAYDGMLSWSASALTVGIGYAVARSFQYVLGYFLDSKLNNRSFGKPTLPNAGYEPLGRSKEQKRFSFAFWTSVIGIKIGWDTLLLHYFMIPHRETIDSVYQPFGPDTININALLMASMWSTSAIFLFMFTWAAIWLVSPFFSYIHASVKGLGAIRTGKDILALQRDNTLNNLIEQKLLPKGGLGLSADQREKGRRMIISTTVDQHLRRDEISIEENERAKNEGRLDHFADAQVQKNIAQALNGLTMNSPVMPAPEKAFRSTVLNPVYGEDIIYPYEDVNENKIILAQGILNLKNGSVILESLIRNGILEDMGNGKVRILPDLDIKMNLVSKIAGSSLDDLLAILQKDSISTALDVMLNVGYTNLNYIISVNPKRWENFINRMKHEGKASPEEIDLMMRLLRKNGKLGQVNPELKMEIRLWASYEGQPYVRTLDGMLNIVRSYHNLFAIAHPDWTIERIQEETNKKFQLLWAYQIWGDILAANEDRPDLMLKKRDTEFLVRKYYRELGFIIDIASLQVRNGIGYKVLSRYNPDTDRIEDVWAIELTENRNIVAEGKPSNHLHATTFVTGQITFTIDMNQDLDPLEAAKLPGVLERFKDKKIAGINMPEVIFTSGFSKVGMYHNVADRTFNSSSKRLKSMLGFIDVHGHPDGLRDSSIYEAGGVSSLTVIPEDSDGGDEFHFQGANIISEESIQFKKGREVSWLGTDGILRKFAMGSAQYLMGRNAYLKNKLFGPVRGAADFYTGTSFFMINTVAPLGFFFYLMNVLILGVSGFTAIPSPIVTWMLGVCFIGQSITTNGFIQSALEDGPIKALRKFPILLLSMAPFFIAHIFTYQAGFLASLMGVAFYVATGRGFNLEHISIDKLMKGFGRSHILLGAIGVALSLVGKNIWNNWTFWLSFNITLSFIFAAIIPTLLNPGSLPGKGISLRKVGDLYVDDVKRGIQTIINGIWKDGIKKAQYSKSIKDKGIKEGVKGAWANTNLRKMFSDTFVNSVVFAVDIGIRTLPALPGVLINLVKKEKIDINKAMVVDDIKQEIVAPEVHSKAVNPGGIDLSRTEVTVNAGKGGVVTSFDDPAILNLLLNADGLKPIIYDIKAMTPVMIDNFVGIHMTNN